MKEAISPRQLNSKATFKKPKLTYQGTLSKGSKILFFRKLEASNGKGFTISKVKTPCCHLGLPLSPGGYSKGCQRISNQVKWEGKQMNKRKEKLDTEGMLEVSYFMKL